MKFDSLLFEIVLIAVTVWQTFMRNAEGKTPVTLPGVGLIYQAFRWTYNSRS